jgi:hypothetical protein
MPVQVTPSPLYPTLQVQEFVPGPVEAQVAFGLQPPLAMVQLLMETHTAPLPE